MDLNRAGLLLFLFTFFIRVLFFPLPLSKHTPMLLLIMPFVCFMYRIFSQSTRSFSRLFFSSFFFFLVRARSVNQLCLCRRIAVVWGAICWFLCLSFYIFAIFCAREQRRASNDDDDYGNDNDNDNDDFNQM